LARHNPWQSVGGSAWSFFWGLSILMQPGFFSRPVVFMEVLALGSMNPK
jgi:hypothetical protein